MSDLDLSRLSIDRNRDASYEATYRPQALYNRANEGFHANNETFLLHEVSTNLPIYRPDTGPTDFHLHLPPGGYQLVLVTSGMFTFDYDGRIFYVGPGAVMLQQFRNPANPEIHRRTTAEEIWADMAGDIDVFVAGVGTGGTITGVGEVLKARSSNCRVVAVEPAGAAVLSGGVVRSHHVPGLGAGFVPEILNRAVIDEVIAVNEEQAVRAQLQLARKEGIAAGISSGAALAAALLLAHRPGSAGKRFVVVLPDGGERYAASPAFVETVRLIEGN